MVENLILAGVRVELCTTEFGDENASSWAFSSTEVWNCSFSALQQEFVENAVAVVHTIIHRCWGKNFFVDTYLDKCKSFSVKGPCLTLNQRAVYNRSSFQEG